MIIAYVALVIVTSHGANTDLKFSDMKACEAVASRIMRASQANAYCVEVR
jgi:hypothetical protein